MEPMNLGSPTGSPAANTSYLPSFLMGEQAPTTPRNTLSPNKAGRNISFATSPVSNSPKDYNRSGFGQKTLFGDFTSPNNYPGTPLHSHNVSISGPPTQGLFDSLRQERTQLHTPTRHLDYSCNTQASYGFNDSYVANTSAFNTSARNLVSPVPTTLLNTVAPSTLRPTDFWVTVFGFPPSAASTVLQHFSKCGTILDKVFPPQNGNWVHIRYSSRLECDKALNFNEKIIGNIMIGVTQCHEKSIADKENVYENRTPVTSTLRPLTHAAYKSVQNESSVVASPNTPQRSTGIVNKAMDLLFGW